MNGARSTFMRKGYLLTALAAAVLLAASPGIASAQSIGFVGSSGTLQEGAVKDMDPMTPDPLVVTINVSGVNMDNASRIGTITLRHNADDTDGDGADDLTGTNPAAAGARRVWQLDSDGNPMTGGVVGTAAGATALVVPTDGSNIRLALIDVGGDGNWKDESITMTLRSSAIGFTPRPDTFSVTIVDDEDVPAARFSAASFRMTEGTATSNPVTTISVGVNTQAMETLPGDFDASNSYTAGTGTAASPYNLGNSLRFTVSRPKAISLVATQADADCSADDATSVIMSGAVEAVPADAMAGIEAGTTYQTTASIQDIANGTGPGLGFTACGDMADFRDANIMFDLVPASLVTTSGTLTNSGGFMLTIDSDDDVPVVSFATTDVSVDENDTTSVFIVAEGMAEQAGQVGTVDVEVGGYARIHLTGDNVTANDDGSYAVSFGMDANTRLNIRAAGDESLNDDETKTATITITDGNGAEIGEDDSVTVTVRGSTAVPALPLIAQLLLALFLMAGGSRLYRRRQS